MQKKLLSTLAVLSLVVAAMLAFGYVGRIGIEIYDARPSGPPPLFRAVDLSANDGRLVCYVPTYPIVPGGQYRPGAHVLATCRVRPKLRLWRAIWEFDAHTNYGGASISMGVYAAPIWCFEVPLLIAPLLWMRGRRRQRRTLVAEGFAVIAL